MDSRERVMAAIQRVVEALQAQAEVAPEALKVQMLRQKAEMVAWQRAQERAEELHSAQLKFWRQFDISRLFGRASRGTNDE